MMTGILTSTRTRKALEVLEEEGVVKISERIITPWYLATPTRIYQNFQQKLIAGEKEAGSHQGQLHRAEGRHPQPAGSAG